jgi:hypothetical protein
MTYRNDNGIIEGAASMHCTRITWKSRRRAAIFSGRLH